MNQKSLIELLKNFESKGWGEREVDGTGEILRWFPIINVKDHCFGLAEDGIWRGKFSDQCRVTPQKLFLLL